MADKKIVGLDLNLDQDYIASAVQDVINAGIVSALGDPGSIITAAVGKVLNQRVDEKGHADTGYRSIPYLNWLAKETIEKTMREILAEYVEEHRCELKAELLRQLKSKKFTEDATAAFISTIIKSATNTYRMPVTVAFEMNKDY